MQDADGQCDHGAKLVRFMVGLSQVAEVPTSNLELLVSERRGEALC